MTAFQKQSGCEVQAIAVGDAGQLVSRLAIDAKAARAPAQVVLGIDQQTWEKIRAWVAPLPSMPWPRWRAEAQEILAAGGLLAQGFVPFDYGVFAWMWDSQSGGEPPRRWVDLLDRRWKRKLLLEDPRLSTPGLAFVLGAREAWGAEWPARARTLSAQWLTLAPSWDQAYGMFLKGAAPLVWSYTTSQAYHVEHEKTPAARARYRAVVFEDGNPVQLEGAAMIAAGVTDPGARASAQKFLRFLVSAEAQALVPRTNWMYPAIADAPLPKSFAELPRARKLLRPSFAAAEVDRVLRDWLPLAQSGGQP
jgi:thiamine transport system substrate-binding protein